MSQMSGKKLSGWHIYIYIYIYTTQIINSAHVIYIIYIYIMALYIIFILFIHLFFIYCWLYYNQKLVFHKNTLKMNSYILDIC